MGRSERRLNNQPKYKIGQVVKVKIKTKDNATGLTFENEIEAFISVIKASGTDMKDTYEYGVTLDLPGCWHPGEKPFAYIYEDDIILASKE